MVPLKFNSLNRHRRSRFKQKIQKSSYSLTYLESQLWSKITLKLTDSRTMRLYSKVVKLSLRRTCFPFCKSQGIQCVDHTSCGFWLVVNSDNLCWKLSCLWRNYCFVTSSWKFCTFNCYQRCITGLASRVSCQPDVT